MADSASQPYLLMVSGNERLSAGFSSRIALLTTGLFSAAVIISWLFPAIWYTRTDAQIGSFWLAEQTNITAWTYQEVPVSKSAEAVLVADNLVNGEFATANRERLVRVFSAKRYVESQNEIGLFVHTPDRCWTESGWKMEPTQPEVSRIDLHGIPLVLERRIFVNGPVRELVYFAGLVGGQPLPYRLDHNLSVGMKHALRTASDETGTSLRASDKRFWQHVWDSFTAGRRLIGPKQFIRISTPITEGAIGHADALLTEFLPKWLVPVDYDKELQAYRKNGS